MKLKSGVMVDQCGRGGNAFCRLQPGQLIHGDSEIEIEITAAMVYTMVYTSVREDVANG